MYQLIDWLTNPPSVEELPNIDWLIASFPGTKKNYSRPDPDINLWVQTVRVLNDILSNILNIKGSLVFFPYRLPYGIK